MSPRGLFSFRKEERIVGKSLVDRLFRGGESRSMSSYPLRAVYCLTECGESDAPVRMMVSVPKRYFKHAVDRNRIKRQVREAYRHNKSLLWDAMQSHEGESLAVAFIWLDNHHRGSEKVEERMVGLLQRISEKL